jgi:ribonuclease HII
MSLIQSSPFTHTLLIAGMDEVGRGALAGPVVAAACILSQPLVKRQGMKYRWSPFKRKPAGKDCLIADSKQLTPEDRERAYEWLTANCAYGIGITEASVIDSKGILFSTNEAMRQALKMLRERSEIHEVLIDGRDAFTFEYPHRSIIKGDLLEPCIGAASIIAKVTRDRMMTEMSEQYPHYFFAESKGYGSSNHIENLKLHGPCPLHRRSFLRNIFPDLYLGTQQQISLLDPHFS